MNPRDRVVVMLVSGLSAAAAESWCVQQGLSPAEAREAIAEARQRITVAASYARDEQIGRAVMRLEDLYAKSIAAKDTRTALQAQRELNRLLSLYADKGAGNDREDDPDDGRGRTLELIASHLLPLQLTEESYPVEEHARIAADLIRQHGLAPLRG